MTRSSSHSKILALSLAFLMTGLVACSKGSEGEATPEAAQGTEAGAEAPAGTQTGAQGATAPGQPGQPGASLPGAVPGPPADTSKMPAVVARINGVDIKKDELLTEAKEMQARFAQANRGAVPPLDDKFYKQILDGMIAQKLLLAEAAREGVTVSDEDVKTQVAALRGRFPDQAAFENALKTEGMTEQELLKTLREEAVIQKYVGTKIFNSVQVTDQAARQFYDQNQDKMQRPERVHAKHVLIGVQPNASAEDKQKARAKAEDVLKRAKAGEDFGKLASENSDDPGSKVQGGDLSWFSRGQMVPPFDQAVFALAKPNDLSDVVETQFGYHVIQLVEKQGPSAVPFEEAKPRIDQMLKQQQAGKRLQDRVEELKKKGKVEVFL